MLDQTEGPSNPAPCSHSGQPSVDQGPTKQDMVQKHPPTHVPQQWVHTGLLSHKLGVAHNHSLLLQEFIQQPFKAFQIGGQPSLHLVVVNSII